VGHVVRQDIPLNYRDVVVSLAQDAGGQQTSHARPEHNGMITHRGRSHNDLL
jgi:hypothetical protein